MVFLAIINFIVSAPLDLMDIFHVKDSFGYNNQTLYGWISDLIKGFILKIVIMLGFLWVLLWIIHSTGD